METFIAIVIIFGLLISIHELGHLLLAKKAGILCREFAIGFGPKLFSIRKRETIYTVRLLPIGGFVRMAGEDPETIELKPGQQIGLVFDQVGKVKEMIVNNRSKHPEARMITVEEADLEEKCSFADMRGKRTVWKPFMLMIKLISSWMNSLSKLPRRTGSLLPNQYGIVCWLYLLGPS
ncbi:MAG TPA: site-2 protease family protein [Bacillales bacterium]|nr:site-2 protease family protein [Bacillales bacterium]